MVDLTTATFLVIAVGILVIAAIGGYVCGEEGERKRGKQRTTDWSVIEVPVSAARIAFHVEHRRSHYDGRVSFEVGQANLDDDEELATKRALADQRAESFNARQLREKVDG